MSLYVAVDIGCLGEESAVLGIFASKETAEKAAEDGRVKQKANGRHSFEVFEVENEVTFDGDI